MQYHGGNPPRLASPPRRVSLGLKISLLFGGPLSGFGWMFLGFGGIFFWIFAVNGDYSFITFTGEKIETAGTVVRSEKTNASVGGSDSQPGTPVYANVFRYVVGVEEFESVSYATGRRLGRGTEVQVEYLLRNPRLARIKNMRRAIFPPFVAFVILFPLIGLGFVVSGLRRGWKNIHLLTVGLASTGKLRAKIPTRTKINNLPVYRLIFDYTTPDGRQSTITVRALDTTLLEDDERERLLYDPSDMESGITLDNLPGDPVIDPGGNLKAGVYFSTLGNLVIPLATIGGHGWWFYVQYLAP